MREGGSGGVGGSEGEEEIEKQKGKKGRREIIRNKTLQPTPVSSFLLSLPPFSPSVFVDSPIRPSVRPRPKQGTPSFILSAPGGGVGGRGRQSDSDLQRKTAGQRARGEVEAGGRKPGEKDDRRVQKKEK